MTAKEFINASFADQAHYILPLDENGRRKFYTDLENLGNDPNTVQEGLKWQNTDRYLWELGYESWRKTEFEPRPQAEQTQILQDISGFPKKFQETWSVWGYLIEVRQKLIQAIKQNQNPRLPIEKSKLIQEEMARLKKEEASLSARLAKLNGAVQTKAVDPFEISNSASSVGIIPEHQYKEENISRLDEKDASHYTSKIFEENKENKRRDRDEKGVKEEI